MNNSLLIQGRPQSCTIDFKGSMTLNWINENLTKLVCLTIPTGHCTKRQNNGSLEKMLLTGWWNTVFADKCFCQVAGIQFHWRYPTHHTGPVSESRYTEKQIANLLSLQIYAQRQ